MGLFINNNKHPEVFKNSKIRNEHNQEIHRKGFLAELLQNQQNTNTALSQSLNELIQNNEKQKRLDSAIWKDLKEQLNDSKKREIDHYSFEVQMVERLRKMEDKNKTIQALIEKESLLKQEIINQMQIQNSSRQEMAKRIEGYEALTQRLTKQIEEQQIKLNEKTAQDKEFQAEMITRLDKQKGVNDQLTQQIEIQTTLEKDIAEKITQQDGYHTEILTRLDKQEALIEKLVRQMTHIRSIFFERTHFLAAKIEDGYKLTSSYVYKLLTGSETPLSFYTVKNQKEEN